MLVEGFEALGFGGQVVEAGNDFNLCGKSRDTDREGDIRRDPSRPVDDRRIIIGA